MSTQRGLIRAIPDDSVTDCDESEGAWPSELPALFVRGEAEYPVRGKAGAVLAAKLLFGALLVGGTWLAASHVPGSAAKEVATENVVLKATDNSGGEPRCSSQNDNCNVTKCCAGPGLACFAQDPHYAQCRESCRPGPIPTHWDKRPWSCEALGNRTAGTKECSAAGENCLHTRCCREPGTQCFEKGPAWAACKAQCAPGAPDTSDADPAPWSCRKLGGPTPGPQGWVWTECAGQGENCAQKKCCLDGGHQCYSQSGPVGAPYWAQCKQHCAPGYKANPWEQPWECKEIGSRTPSAPQQASLLAEWAKDRCSRHGDNCLGSMCCLGMDAQCYGKNSTYAACRTSCSRGPNPERGNESWSCRKHGSRGFGMAVKGSPSLFCFSLMQIHSYEADIMRGQMNLSAGIFSCDETAVFAADGQAVLGPTPDGRTLKTIKVRPAVIRVTADGTAGNARLFANVWDKVVEGGRWRDHAWTLKADPDAVIMPDRVRRHVRAHTGQSLYVLNCNKVPNSPNFPMMFGSVELLSFGAMRDFASGKESCTDTMGQWLESWGEDYYLGKCMDLIGVGRIADFSLVGDSVCTGADCNNPAVASFHAFKSWDLWKSCHERALNATRRR